MSDKNAATNTSAPVNAPVNAPVSAPVSAPAQTSRSLAIPILAVVALAQLALIAWLFWPQPTQAAAGKLFANLDPAPVNAITIKWEDKSLAMQKSGDGWVLPERGNFPVNAIAVTDLLTKVVQIDTSRLVASNASSHERLRVDAKNPIRRVEMTTADGKSYTLFVGSAPNARATNVRADGSDNVYLTSALSTGDVRVDLPAWVNTEFQTLDPATINGLSVKNASGDFNLAKDSAGEWLLPDLAPGETMITSTVAPLVRSLATLSLSDVMGAESKPEFGLDAPTATVTLSFAPVAPVTATAALTDSAALTASTAPTVSSVPTAPVTLVIGAKDDASGSYYVKASNSPWYVRVAAATLDPLVKLNRAALVAPPPAAATTTLPLTPGTLVTATAPLSESAPVTAGESITP